MASGLLLLFETAAGFALFKVLDEGKIRASDPQVHIRLAGRKDGRSAWPPRNCDAPAVLECEVTLTSYYGAGLEHGL